MFIPVNMLSKRLTYFSKRTGTVSLGGRSNSGKVGRLIAIAEAVEGCEGEVVDEESAGIENKVDR